MQKGILNGVLSGRRNSFTLRMAPMIDMVFLLLIFFLVAAKWRPEENFLPFQLPAAQAQGHRLARPEPLRVHITAMQTGCQVQIGRLYTVRLEEQTIEKNLVELAERMRDCLAEQKRYVCDPVEIVCEPSVKWEQLAKIYDMFFGAGLTDITFMMTELPNDGNFD